MHGDFGPQGGGLAAGVVLVALVVGELVSEVADAPVVLVDRRRDSI
jgi:hypothetical protein